MAYNWDPTDYAPKELRNWNEYKLRLEKQGDRMTYEGINYYRDSTIWKNN